MGNFLYEIKNLQIKSTPESGAIKILNKYPFGIGNHQISNNATKVKRKPINKKGGSSTIAGFAITKPKPRKIGTSAAINESRSVKC